MEVWLSSGKPEQPSQRNPILPEVGTTDANFPKNSPIRVHLCPSVVENARLSKNACFRPKIAIFHRKTAQNSPITAFSDPFSPARPVAARFVDHLLPKAYAGNDKELIFDKDVEQVVIGGTRPIKKRNINISIRIVGAAMIAASMAGCATGYMADRGRDAADIFTVGVGYGLGTKVRVGPVQLGLLYEISSASLRGGELSADNQETVGPETGDALRLILGTESLFKCRLPRNKNFLATNLNVLPEESDTLFLIPFIYAAKPLQILSRTATRSSPKDQPPPYYYYSQIEFVASLYRSIRIGFNPGELLDFLLGWTTLDIYSDDVEVRKGIE